MLDFFTFSTLQLHHMVLLNEKKVGESTYYTKPHFAICEYFSLSNMDESKYRTFKCELG